MTQLCNDRSLVRVYNEETNAYELQYDADGSALTQPCKNYAMKGLDKCLMHARAGQRRSSYVKKHQLQLGTLLAEMDIPSLNPMDGLLEAVRYSGAMMRSLAVIVGELLERPELVADGMGGAVMIEAGMWGLDRFGEQAPHVVMKLYDIWMQRYTQACKLSIDAGLDERLVRNAEATSVTMVRAFRAALDQVQLTDDQKRALARAMAEQVRALSAGHGVET